jgi:cyclic dehypoxanthinyl futalosine synthase
MTHQQALDFFLSSDLIGLGIEADAARKQAHPEDVVTYLIMDEASFKPGEDCSKAEEKTGIRIEPWLEHTMEEVEDTLRSIKKNFPNLYLRADATGVLHLAERSHLDLEKAMLRLREAGLDSIVDDGIALQNCSVKTDDWFAVHCASHRAGMKTSATVIFGMGESFEQRLNVLDKVRQLQRETGGFNAFVPLSYAPARDLDAPTGAEYLKMVAISRLYLPEIEHIEASSAAQGLKVLQMALRFGADDAGPVPSRATEEDLRYIIRDAGFRPAQRDLLYRMMVFN